MKIKLVILVSLLLLPGLSFTQTGPTSLSIEKIMQDSKWVGVSPEDIFWSEDGSKFYFSWDSGSSGKMDLYSFIPEDHNSIKIEQKDKPELLARYGNYNKDKSKKVFSRNGDIFILNVKTGKTFQLTNTLDYENSPTFSFDQEKIIYSRDGNLFSSHLNTGQTIQLTNFTSSPPRKDGKTYTNEQEKWLYDQQLSLFQVIRERKIKNTESDEEKSLNKPHRPKEIFTGKERPGNIQLCPDEKFVTYLIYKPTTDSKNTIIPNYVDESGYTETNKARSKVGTPYFETVELFIYDIENDTVYQVSTDQISGINKQADYLSEYPIKGDTKISSRKVSISSPVWSEDGMNAVLEINSLDYKDRWIMLIDISSGDLKLLDHQHDEAWIGGPGIGWWGGVLGWMPDNKKIYFQSEETGYSHLYTVNIENGKKKALTKGDFEVYNPYISNDNKSWYFSSNEVNSGERHFYKMPLKGGKAIQLTAMEGSNKVTLSPDGKWMGILFSSATQPWDIYIKKTEPEAKTIRFTYSQSEEFQSYSWRTPSYVKLKASDGVMVPARLYLPETPAESKPAVIFVHGAGYLQNAHKWWSSYFREYMFHNFLVDNGYTVLDIDYRGSAGYGRDWRTAIYRHMGGKDLSDQIDGAGYLVKEHGISSENIGIYGGSYGGFITLMALFKNPDVFGAGAALRSVTDWAHYSHGYTANILNTPVMDSLAYVRSSPIYFAEGLSKPLLICHGMVDDNVHFQDVVRLAQRLIELGKDNWEMAIYPIERHGFVEPSSWTDEYKRIFKLFEQNLK